MRPLPSNAIAVGSWMIGIGQHQLEAIAGLQDELLQLLLRRLRQDRRLLREVDAGQILTTTTAASGISAALPRRARSAWRRCRGRLDRPALPAVARPAPAFAQGQPGLPPRARTRARAQGAVCGISSSYFPFPQAAAGYHPVCQIRCCRRSGTTGVTLRVSPGHVYRHLACGGEPDGEARTIVISTAGNDTRHGASSSGRRRG